MITHFDIELINKILEPFNIVPLINNKIKKSFLGYKLDDSLYYSFTSVKGAS